MLSIGSSLTQKRFSHEPDKNGRILQQMTTEELNALNKLRNRSSSEGRKDLIIKDPPISDDGYFSLANLGGKTEQKLLFPPTNSWPLQRKIGAKELKEYGDKLDSGSETLLGNKTSERLSQNSVCSHSGSVLIEREIDPPYDDEKDCISQVENCIDCCTCMLCVKSAYYLCCDGEDDTGTEGYDPCYCGKPSTSCFKRWSCLGLLAFFVPCIICYPVGRGCVTKHRKSKRQRDKTKRGRFKIRFTKNRRDGDQSS